MFCDESCFICNIWAVLKWKEFLRGSSTCPIWVWPETENRWELFVYRFHILNHPIDPVLIANRQNSDRTQGVYFHWL